MQKNWLGSKKIISLQLTNSCTIFLSWVLSLFSSVSFEIFLSAWDKPQILVTNTTREWKTYLYFAEHPEAINNRISFAIIWKWVILFAYYILTLT